MFPIVFYCDFFVFFFLCFCNESIFIQKLKILLNEDDIVNHHWHIMQISIFRFL